MPYWQGVECEGRLAGVPTLFVRNDWTVPQRLIQEYRHIYLNPPEPFTEDGFRAQCALGAALVSLAPPLPQPLVTFVVALDRLPSLPDKVTEHAHLVVDLPNGLNGLHIKADDEFRWRKGGGWALVRLGAARWTSDADVAYIADRPVQP